MCRPLKSISKQTETSRVHAADYYSISYERPGAAEQFWPQRHISSFPPASQTSLGSLELGPLDLLADTQRI